MFAARPCGFNPLPAFRPGETVVLGRQRRLGLVSTHSRLFGREKLAEASRASIGQKFQPTPGFSAGRNEQTAAKQRAVHPEITPQEYAQAQRVIDGATAKAIQDNVDAQGRKTGTQSLVYVIEEASAETGGHVLVVKATRSGDALWITSFRRLSRDAAARDAEVSRVLRGERRK